MQFAVVQMTLRLLFITYFIDQTILMKGGHSGTNFKENIQDKNDF